MFTLRKTAREKSMGATLSRRLGFFHSVPSVKIRWCSRDPKAILSTLYLVIC